MSWEPKIGDIGRFVAESDGAPRFVVVRVHPNVVQVWYSGAGKSNTIPRKTFDLDCIDTWRINVVEAPPWVQPKAQFRLDDWVTLAKITDDPRRPRSTTRVERLDLSNQDLRVYSRQYDYAACLAPGLKTMVLVPVKAILQHGYRVRTKWDRILDDDDFDDFEDYL